MDCYVYYKTAQEHEQHVIRQTTIMHETLTTHIKIGLHLQRRPVACNGVITWMEIYRHIPVSFDAILAHIVSQTELMSLIQGERHIEYFEDAISCA